MTVYTPTPAERARQYQGAIRPWVCAPSIVSPGQPFDIRVSLLQVDGYQAVDFVGELQVEGVTAIAGLPERLVFSSDDQGGLLLSGCSISQEGLYRFKVMPTKGSYPAGECHPVWVRKDFPYRLYWGDLHVHSELGKCGTPHQPKSPDFGYRFARDVLSHDYCGMADHASKLYPEDWEELKASAERWLEPGRFVSVLGFEGDYDGEDGGHFNLHFSDADGEYKNFKQNAGGTLEATFEFAEAHHALAICHHTSRSHRGRDFSKSHFGGQHIEPVMEIYSQWGSSEEYASSRPTIEGRHPGAGHYYRYALSHGFTLGVVGGSDSHCTVPGGATPMVYPAAGGKLWFPYPGGVGAVYAKELTRKGLFEAIRARRCYATSLEKILVWVESAGQPMGSEIQANSAALDILVSGAHTRLVEVAIVRNGQVADTFGEFGKHQGFDDQRKTFNLTWRDPDFPGEANYYVRATQFDGDMAWSSPIWIRKG